MRLSAFKEQLNARPFRRFVVELDNGRQIGIRHPEDIVKRDGLVIVFKGAGDIAAIFEVTAVSAILPGRRTKR